MIGRPAEVTGLDILRRPTLSDKAMYPGWREQSYYWRQIARLEAIDNQWIKGVWPKSLALRIERASLIREIKCLAPSEFRDVWRNIP